MILIEVLGLVLLSNPFDLYSRCRWPEGRCFEMVEQLEKYLEKKDFIIIYNIL